MSGKTIVTLCLCVCLLAIPLHAAAASVAYAPTIVIDEREAIKNNTPEHEQAELLKASYAPTIVVDEREAIKNNTPGHEQAELLNTTYVPVVTVDERERFRNETPGQEVSELSGSVAAGSVVDVGGHEIRVAGSGSDLADIIDSERAALGGAGASEVTLALYSLASAQALAGSHGLQVSEFVSSLEASSKNMTALEERIRNRDPISRIISGGDRSAALGIETETGKNTGILRELRQIFQGAGLDAATSQVIATQISVLEKEQTRLAEISQKEKSDRGIFGWLTG
ncbi:MAG: hypothetical protein LUQ25_04830 [Methanoregulaceae archaeon]|nr:hypothetical protein [Methanoregulaceae archaeon]